jgi:hypothetical protein
MIIERNNQYGKKQPFDSDMDALTSKLVIQKTDNH